MRRITKLAAVATVLLLGLPAFAVFNLFGGAEAAAVAPHLYSISEDDPVVMVDYADKSSDHTIYAYVLWNATSQSSKLIIREKNLTGLHQEFDFAGGTEGRIITSMAISRDGTSIVLGFKEGWIHYMASVSGPFDSQDTFRTRSPVSAVDIDETGRFFTAVTFHGDLFFFEREQFFQDSARFRFHHNPLIPLGLLNPDQSQLNALGEYPKDVGDALEEHAGVEDDDPIPEAIRRLNLTVRPYTHVAIVGEAQGTTPNLMGVVAGDAFGSVHVFDISSAITLPTLTFTPESIDLLERECRIVPTPVGPVQVPCNSDAMAMLVDEVNGLTSGEAREVLEPVSNAVRGITALDDALGIFGQPRDEPPIREIVGTRGNGNTPRQTIAVHFADEFDTVNPEKVAGVMSRFGAARGAGETAQRLWTVMDAQTITDIDLSQSHAAHGVTGPTLAIANAEGEVRLYRVPGGITQTLPSLPIAQLYKPRDTNGDPVGVNHVSITFGDRTGRSNAGLYVGLTTDDNMIHLISTNRQEEEATATTPGVPFQHYTGQLPVGDAVTGVDMTDAGGVLVGHDNAGISLYGDLLTVTIIGPTQMDKFQTWEGTAEVFAPDTTPVSYDWTITPTNNGNPSAIVQLTTTLPTLSHVFEYRGTYRIDVTVTDDHNLTAFDSHNVNVGVKPPVVVIDAPDEIQNNTNFNIDFNGTHDPDASPNSTTLGIQEIRVFTDGVGIDVTADLNTFTATTQLFILGEQTIRIEVEDEDGIVVKVSVKIIVSDDIVIPPDCDDPIPPAWCEKDKDDNDHGNPDDPGHVDPVTPGDLRLRRIDRADHAGTSVAYGGDGSGMGRYRFHGYNGTHQASVGNFTHSPITSHIRSGVMLHDGSTFIGGLMDGRAVLVHSVSPTQQFYRDIGDEPWVSVILNAAGDRVLFVSNNGNITIRSTDLFTEYQRFDLNQAVRSVQASHDLRTVAIISKTGTVSVFDGAHLDTGPEDTDTVSGTPTFADMPKRSGQDGAFALSVGLSNGNLHVLRVKNHVIDNVGTLGFDGRPVYDIEVTPMTSVFSFQATVITRGSLSCTPNVSCGGIFHIDTAATPPTDSLPGIVKSHALASPAGDLMMTHDMRHFGVMSTNEAKFALYDTYWDQGPLQTFSLVGGVGRDFDFLANGSVHFLHRNGGASWFFAPPTATYAIGPHNATGVPQYGDPVTAGNPTTFDGTPTDTGGGYLTLTKYDLGDSTTSATLVTTHTYASKQDCQWYSNIQHTCKTQLQVFAQNDDPLANSPIKDRHRIQFQVHNPPPIAVLTATPFNTTTQRVEVHAGDTVRFNASASSDAHAGGKVVSYHFLFGDTGGRSILTPIANYQYERPGTYFATLRVKDNDGFEDLSDPVEVLVINQLPIPKIKYSQPQRNETFLTVTIGAPVNFDGAGSFDKDGSVTFWEWFFVEGSTNTTATGRFPSYTWNIHGPHEMGLRVKDNSGGWSQWLKVTFNTDDGIRLKQIHKESDQRYLNTIDHIWVDGFVHDWINHPADGTPIVGATVFAKVYYDGPYNTTKAEDPYHERTVTTDGDGIARYIVKKNDADVTYLPGRYRVEMTAMWSGSHGGDTEYTIRTETVFFVEDSI